MHQRLKYTLIQEYERMYVCKMSVMRESERDAGSGFLFLSRSFFFIYSFAIIKYNGK